MNEESHINYYAIIPATVRYDKELKPSEKLLYGEITALANKYGFCYAKNRYFANLYNVSINTVSRWISHLQQLGYIKVDVIKNEMKEIISRNIYIIDTPYLQKNQYPYLQKDQESIYKKVKDNNINMNKDDLFYCLINNNSKIEKEFLELITKLEFNYTNDIIKIMKKDKIDMLKDIIYTLYIIYNSKHKEIVFDINRKMLINLYISALEYNPKDIIKYYKKSIINKYNNSS